MYPLNVKCMVCTCVILLLTLAPGNGYHIFAGKDASRGLGMSSLNPEDAVSDYSTLSESQMKVLNDWVCLSEYPIRV